MHIGSAVHNTVVFLGFEDTTKPGGIACQGTGFLVHHDGVGYLITAKHVARLFGSDPFVIRVNTILGGSKLVHVDQATWSFHIDISVDAALMPMSLFPRDGFASQYLNSDMFATEARIAEEALDVGDVCYTLGLFQFIYGNSKNLPLVFSGNISLMPPAGEKIPISARGSEQVEHVEGYVIESRAIHGSSGAPVFTRSSSRMNWPPYKTPQDERVELKVQKNPLILLGLFMGAWFLPPDPTIQALVRSKASDVVPVGVGLVVPAIKILDILNSELLKTARATSNDSDFRLTATSTD